MVPGVMAAGGDLPAAVEDDGRDGDGAQELHDRAGDRLHPHGLDRQAADAVDGGVAASLRSRSSSR